MLKIWFLLLASSSKLAVCTLLIYLGDDTLDKHQMKMHRRLLFFCSPCSCSSGLALSLWSLYLKESSLQSTLKWM
ncbi:hypothetical protein BS78_03G217900 [Paspalum vaginatum]|nr:hypothetical protein BS78_03G217900 [Paspalum vaginatum]